MIPDKTIRRARSQACSGIDLSTVPSIGSSLGPKTQGKVRDIYADPFGQRDTKLLIATDRQSAFDRHLGLIPYKGAVLTLLSQFWFEQTAQIIPNHLIAVPHPNVSHVRACQAIPVEMIVRGYLTGVTQTSIWHSYQAGEREIYGQLFPDGLVKNDPLPQPVITPTTHGGGAGGHDERLTRDQIRSQGIVESDLYDKMEQTALALFAKGTEVAQKAGLILVDTKYEFGLLDGQLVLIDEIHTPDSSRFWDAATYHKCKSAGQEPDNYDKEYLRLWYAQQGYTGDGQPPEMTDELATEVARRYLTVYERLTGSSFPPRRYGTYQYPIEDTLTTAIARYAPPAPSIPSQRNPVSQAAGDAASEAAQQAARSTYRPEVTQFGPVAGFSARFPDTKDPYLIAATDGVGSKLHYAVQTGIHTTIGQDLVAMTVNDLLRRGAEPLFFAPYLAVQTMDPQLTADLNHGIVQACSQANCSIIAGETAQMSDLYRPGEYDIAGTAVGVVDRSRIIDGSAIINGDLLIGIPSSGLHSNGHSLARSVLLDQYDLADTIAELGRQPLSSVLLEPTRIYTDALMPLFTRKIPIHGIAHITGGGIPGKLGAIIPERLMAVVDRSTWTPQPIFDLIQQTGAVSDHEMLASFNMGIGMILVIPPDQEDLIRSQITDAVTIGHITKRTNHHTGTDGSAVTVVPADAV